MVESRGMKQDTKAVRVRCFAAFCVSACFTLRRANGLLTAIHENINELAQLIMPVGIVRSIVSFGVYPRELTMIELKVDTPPSATARQSV